MNISIITLPYNTEGKYTGGGAGPASLLSAGLIELLTEDKLKINEPVEVGLKADQECYGGWRLVGAANACLTDLTAGERDKNNFILGLLANCNGVIGLLGGLQLNQADIQRPKRVGLVWIDAHGDYNTPDTSPSGMLGGMPVAISAGKCLPNMRQQSGLRIPLQSPDIVMMGLRDLDQLEQEQIEKDGIITLTEQQLVDCSSEVDAAMQYLSEREDIIYVHVDLDILNPQLAPAAGLPTPGGLSGQQLGESLRFLLRYPKVKALAMVSYNPVRDDQNFSTRKEIITAIRQGLQGINDRQ